MTTDVDAYCKQLLLAMRLRDVPGPRIADALAQVDSHTAETGEDPREAFGPPGEYADRLLAAAGAGGRRWFHVTWQEGAIAVAALGGGLLLSDGVFAAAAGEPSTVGLPGLVSIVLGLALWGSLGAWLAAMARRGDDRVLDPRSGEEMAPPVPRWSRWLLVASLTLPLGVSAGLGIMQR